MLHTCVQRFDVTKNLKILAKFLASKRCLALHCTTPLSTYLQYIFAPTRCRAAERLQVHEGFFNAGHISGMPHAKDPSHMGIKVLGSQNFQRRQQVASFLAGPRTCVTSVRLCVPQCCSVAVRLCVPPCCSVAAMLARLLPAAFVR
jgi:hypothetical protein